MYLALSHHGVAAVDREQHAVDIARGRREKEQHCRGDVLGLAQAGHRQVRKSFRRRRPFQPRNRAWSQRETGRDRVRARLASMLAGVLTHQRGDRPLGGRVEIGLWTTAKVAGD